MADDIDDLLDEVETKYVKPRSQPSKPKPNTQPASNKVKRFVTNHYLCFYRRSHYVLRNQISIVCYEILNCVYLVAVITIHPWCRIETHILSILSELAPCLFLYPPQFGCNLRCSKKHDDLSADIDDIIAIDSEPLVSRKFNTRPILNMELA